MSRALEARITEPLASRYELERELGDFGTSVEFLARDLESGREVVVSVFPLDPRSDAGTFLRETREALKLRHGHIVRVQRVGEVDGLPYCETPFVEGETLRDVLDREGTLNFEEGIRILRAVADAVAYAHYHGIPHLDLEPSKVLLSAERVQVKGFGLAWARTAASTDSAQDGPQMRPDAGADVRALGAIGYEMLTGRKPLRSETGGPEPVNKLRVHMPPGFAYLVMSCLAEDADERCSVDRVRSLLARMAPQSHCEPPHLVLQGRFLWKQRADGIQKGLRRFQRAVELAPDFAPAHAGLADAYSLLAVYGHLPKEEAVPKARAAAERALELDESSAEARTSIAFVHTIGDWQWRRAKEHFLRALELSPDNGTARAWYAGHRLLVEGQVEGAIEQGQRAVEAEPMSAHGASVLGQMLVYAGRIDDAAIQLRKAVAWEPSWPYYRKLGWAYSVWGMHKEAVETLTTAVETSERHPWALATLGRELAASGRVGEAQLILDELTGPSNRAQPLPLVQPAWVAYLLSALGRTNAVFEWLERAFETRDPTLVFLRGGRTEIDWEPHVATDSRFRPFWRGMGLS